MALYGIALEQIAADPLAPTRDERRQARAMVEAHFRGRQIDRIGVVRVDRVSVALPDKSA